MQGDKNVIHVWDVHEVVLNALCVYENPYMDLDVWIDLKGPGFEKRVYGFWDGGNIFKIRFTATVPGIWSYCSGASCEDAGLIGVNGEFEAISWTEKEKEENISRSGIPGSDKNGHGFSHPDGKSFFMLGDTWWSTPTYRFKWCEDDSEHPIEDGYFKDLAKYRKEQGYNTIAMLAAHPTWANDGKPPQIEIEPGVWARDAWKQSGTKSAKDMHNEGGRPFLFPGHIKEFEDVVPDFTRINPEYFQHMDKKVNYLQSQGLLSFIEVSRRDISTVWKKYGGWPLTYTRYIQYIFARYQANYCLLSPIHFDWEACSIPSKDFNEPINLWLNKYGPPPFGTLVGTNASPSTLVNFGNEDEAPWLTFHQTGNWREHDHHWYLTEIYRSTPAKPAIAGEPYYPGFPDGKPPVNSHDAELNNRAGLYGSILSGAIGGVIYGCEGIWGSDIETEASVKMVDSFKLRSGIESPFVQDFVLSEGDRYLELEPENELVTPNKAGPHLGYRGWAYCAITPERDYGLFYFEKDCPEVIIRGFTPDVQYKLFYFDPVTGGWDAECKEIKIDKAGRASIPKRPQSEDFGIKILKI